MFFGNLVLSMAFASCVIALAGYFLGFAGRRNFLSLGRRAYFTFTVLTFILAGLLLYQILAHDFRIEYVYDYSSTDLPFFLLLSTFWAGQVGTFLLWLLFTAVVGLFIYRRDDSFSSAVMFYYMLAVLFLLTLLAVRSPFRMLPFTPVEGKGLNPLLQNFWMVIHPPIVFLGYAMLTVPFAYAMAALTKNDYTDWTRRVFPWALLSAAVLGLGIFLGGYWAYETLGWGGYWGWDPVENASLIPWVINIALLHGLLVERKYWQLRKTNLFLAAIAFLLVIYGTFLTRSGVLADFSVHSFTDLGMNIYLVLFMVAFFVMILTLFVIRFRHIKPAKKTDDPWSADFLITVGMVVTVAFAVLVLIGTSSPIITRLPFFDAPANVSIMYYSRIALPIGIMMALLAGLTPFLKTKNPTITNVLKKSIPSVVAGIIGAIVGKLLGVDEIKYLLLVFSAIYVVAANVQMLLMSPHKLGRKMGGYLSHIGLGIMLIGFLASSAFSRSEKVVLAEGKPREVMDYSLTYNGMQADIMQEDNALSVDIEKDGKIHIADPRLYFDSFSMGIMRKPYIESHFLYDLYLAPEQVKEKRPGEQVALSKGETATVGKWGITFHKFDLTSHGGAGLMKVGAIVTLYDGSDSLEVIPKITILPSGKREFDPVHIDTSGMVITLEDVDPGRGMVNLRISNKNDVATNILILEVTNKPLILFVWLGALVIVIGTLIAWYHRRRYSVF